MTEQEEIDNIKRTSTSLEEEYRRIRALERYKERWELWHKPQQVRTKGYEQQKPK